MTMTANRARIESLDAPAAFGRTAPFTDVVLPYRPQNAPMPFSAPPVRDAGRAGVLAAGRRVRALGICPRCAVVLPRSGRCDDCS